MSRKLVWLPIWIVICLGVGSLGGVITSTSVDNWYQELQRPGWTPPDWLFGPVWTSLFLIMGCSIWLTHASPRFHKRALKLFCLQLFLNLLWSLFFFGLRSPGLALFEIAFLWVAILATIVTFFRIHRGAALLLTPYLAWVSFAACLNAAFWWLNRGTGG